VAYVHPLSKVPEKFRTDELINLALGRDASQARFLEDPAATMNRIGYKIPGSDIKGPVKHQKEKTLEWKLKAEENGMLYSKKENV
jgi:hypothetical protein